MAHTVLLMFRHGNEVPALDYLESLSRRAQTRTLLLLELLQREGYRLRRPQADFLEDGIYELRVDEGNIHHRFLYFFHGQNVVILTHGLRKERQVPPREIERAKSLRTVYLSDPASHSLEIEL